MYLVSKIADLINHIGITSQPMIARIAWRYLFGKKSTQAINIISWISILSIMVGTASLIIVLSVYNGFESFIKDMYSDYYPELKITAVKGKFFEDKKELDSILKGNNNLKAISKCIEEKVLLTYDEQQSIVTLKGIDESYNLVTAFDKNIRYGAFHSKTNKDGYIPIVLGLGVSNKLKANEESLLPIECYSFSGDNLSNPLDISNAYQSTLVQPSGVFQLQEEIDNQMSFAPLEDVQQLSNHEKQLSSIEIKMKRSELGTETQAALNKSLSSFGLKVENRFEQNKSLYMILKTERVAVFAILAFMMAIASFNIISSLSMLVIEKENDIGIFKAMGMNRFNIRNLFLSVGMLITLVGASLGSIIAYAICFIQIKYKLIKLGTEGNYLLEGYPVKVQLSDFIAIAFVVVIVGLLASWLPSYKASQKTITLKGRN